MQQELEKYQKAPNKVSAKDVIEALKGRLTNAAAGLRPVWIGPNGTIIVPISDELEIVEVHYQEDEDGKKNILCTGPDCLICQAKLRSKKRYLLPVYETGTTAISVLSMSDSLKSDALLPQILNMLETMSDPPQEAIFISRNSFEFEVIKIPLPPEDRKEVESVIKKFNAQVEKGEIDLKSILTKYSEERIRRIPDVAKRLGRFIS